MVEDQQPRVWLKAFWGFTPIDEGYLGFTKVGDQERFLREAQPSDLILIYGADAAETAQEDRRQALGFLQVELTPIKDVDAMSAKGLKRKIDLNARHRWTHAVPVLRAWDVERKIEIKHIAPTTYTHNRARVIASRGELLTPDEAARASRLPVRETSVYGRPAIDAVNARTADLASLFTPSRGLKPAYGPRVSDYADGENFLYMLVAEGVLYVFDQAFNG